MCCTLASTAKSQDRFDLGVTSKGLDAHYEAMFESICPWRVQMDDTPNCGSIRIFLERDGRPTAYAIETPTPGAMQVHELFNVAHVMKRQGLDWAQIAAALVEWSRRTFGVLKTTVSYTGRVHVIAVVASLDTVQQLREMESSLRESLPRTFLASRPQIYSIHPDDVNNTLLTAADVICVYSKEHIPTRIAA